MRESCTTFLDSDLFFESFRILRMLGCGIESVPTS